MLKCPTKVCQNEDKDNDNTQNGDNDNDANANVIDSINERTDQKEGNMRFKRTVKCR